MKTVNWKKVAMLSDGDRYKIRLRARIGDPIKDIAERFDVPREFVVFMKQHQSFELLRVSPIAEELRKGNHGAAAILIGERLAEGVSETEFESARKIGLV